VRIRTLPVVEADNGISEVSAPRDTSTNQLSNRWEGQANDQPMALLGNMTFDADLSIVLLYSFDLHASHYQQLLRVFHRRSQQTSNASVIPTPLG
jgi:hypothetical protein